MKSSLGLKAELAVVDIIKEAIGLLWIKRIDVVRMFLPAMLLLAAVDSASQYFFPQNSEAEVAIFHPEQLLFVLVSAILSILLATACHRFTLLPREQWNTNALHGFGRAEMRYLLRLMQIGVLCCVVLFAVMLPLTALVGDQGAIAAGVIAVMVMLYVWSRLSITLPEVALGQKSTLTRAWQLSRGNGSRLVVVVIVAPVAMTFPFLVLMFTDSEVGVLSYLAAFGTYITTLISLVMLSLSYQFLLDFYDDGGTEKSSAELENIHNTPRQDHSNDRFDA